DLAHACSLKSGAMLRCRWKHFFHSIAQCIVNSSILHTKKRARHTTRCDSTVFDPAFGSEAQARREAQTEGSSPKSSTAAKFSHVARDAPKSETPKPAPCGAGFCFLPFEPTTGSISRTAAE